PRHLSALACDQEHTMPYGVRKSVARTIGLLPGPAPFQHWYKSNQVYFITGKCLEGFPALQSEKAKSIFWDRFEFYSNEAKFQPWVVSLLDNHYHIVGYCELGDNLPEMMRKFHGSTSKLINELLVKRRVPFWRDEHDHD